MYWTAHSQVPNGSDHPYLLVVGTLEWAGHVRAIIKSFGMHLVKGALFPHYLQLACSCDSTARCASADSLTETDTGIKKYIHFTFKKKKRIFIIYVYNIAYFKTFFALSYFCNSYANNNKKTLKQRHLLTHTVQRCHGNIPAEGYEEISAFKMT